MFRRCCKPVMSNKLKHKRAALCAALFFGALVAATSFAGQAEAAPCQSDVVVVDALSGSHTFSVEVADDAQERAQGLMFRDTLDEAAGMLFVYPKPRSVSFWMKNTLIPLDIIFTDQRGVVVSIHENAIPYDETPIFGGDAVFSVLELNAGVSQALDIKIGDVLRHPAYDFYTSLPCSAK